MNYCKRVSGTIYGNLYIPLAETKLNPSVLSKTKNLNPTETNE